MIKKLNKKLIKKLMISFAILLFSVIFYKTTILAIATIYPSYNTEQDCRNCHGLTDGLTVDRHHFLVANGTYQCTDCHAIKYDVDNQTYYPEVIRNCLICHPGKDHTDAHHILVAQGLFVCSDCHKMKYDSQTQTYYPEVTWDCTVCHSTVLSLNDPPPPAPMPTPINPPTTVKFSPPSPVNDIIGDSRKFDISIDQVVDMIWYINGNPVQYNYSVTDASYTNLSAALGVWNITVNASNNNGNVSFTWTWNVAALPPPPKITGWPTSPVNDIVGSSRKFGVITDQITDIVWYIDNNPVQSNNSVMGASFNNSASFGIWNIKAVAKNANGSAAYIWKWNVIDNTFPQITISSPVNNSIYIVKQNLIANWSVSDKESGIASAIGTYPNGSIINTNSVGQKNFSVYAVDNGGNTNTKNVTYYIHYNSGGGFLSPINMDGSSIFKLGSALPVKFQLKDANGNYVTNAVATLNVSKISSTVSGTYLASSPTIASTGEYFIYDNTGHMYMYNFATKNMSIGTWKLRVYINDGSSISVNISIKK